MKRLTKARSVLSSLLILILAFAMVNSHGQFTHKFENNNDLANRSNDLNLQSSPSSFLQIQSLQEESSISISGDSEFASIASTKGWSGDGSPGNPYYIDSINITDPSGQQQYAGLSALSISDTTVYFVVNNSYFSYATIGIELNNVQNGVIANSTFKYMIKSIDISFGANIYISDNSFKNMIGGVSADQFYNSEIDGNIFTEEESVSTAIDISIGDQINITQNNFNEISNNIKISEVTSSSIDNNNILNAKRTDLEIFRSEFVSINDNTLEIFGISLQGTQVSHFTHFDMNNNQVGGKPLYYIANSTSETVAIDFGQLIVVNSSSITVESYDSIPSRNPILMGFVNDSIIQQSIFTDQEITIIEGQNVVIEENSFTYQSLEILYLSAIDIVNSNSIRIVNNTFTDHYSPLSFYLSSSSIIEDNLFTGIKGTAIGLHDSYSSSVIDNNITKSEIGIYITGAVGYPSNHEILRNYINSTENSFKLSGSIGNSINNNTLTGGEIEIIEFGVDYDVYDQTEVLDNMIDGKDILYLVDQQGTTIKGDYGQVIIAQSQDLLIESVMIENRDIGMIIADSNNISLTDITISNNKEIGIKVYDSTDIIIKNSKISNVGTGIKYQYSENNDLINSSLRNNEYGIEYLGSVDNNVVTSLFEHNEIAIDINGGSDNNQIFNSVFYNSSSYAITTVSFTSDIQIMYNDFIANNIGQGSQILDNGEDSEIRNNYWSDWVSVSLDSNKDGFLDLPYPIDGESNNIDPRPKYASYQELLIPEPPSDLAVEVINNTVELTWDVNSPKSDIRFYRIYRTVANNSGFELVGFSYIQSFSQIVEQPGEYEYYISSVTFYGESDLSDPITVRIENGSQQMEDTNLFQDNLALITGIVGFSLLATIGLIVRRRRSG